VEEVLRHHPDVAEVGVVGAPDPDKGEIVLAFVVAKPGARLTEDILRGHGLSYDRAAFDDAMRAQAERARAAWKGSGEAAPAEVYGALASAKPVAPLGSGAQRCIGETPVMPEEAWGRPGQ
jgi:acyl-CoA synthetase (AMP-forming)/AMP-acid ligase II